MGRKSEEIKIHVEPDLKQEVQEAAKQKDLSVSSYARMKLKDAISPKVEA